MDSATLLLHLGSALQSTNSLRRPGHQRKFQLALLHPSTARRTYSLFPWASEIPSNKCTVQDFLLVAAEWMPDAEGYVPVYALEGALFNLANSNAALVYISKVDTTGLSLHTSPARILTIAFLSNLTNHHSNLRFRLHVFAKPAPQYLFPGSSNNKGKKQLSDQQLAKWWMRILAHLDLATSNSQAYCSIPGLEWPDIKRLLSPIPSNWHLGLPMSSLLTLPPDATPTLGDIIPAFPDDPKSRYLTSLTSSPCLPAGEKGDYDVQTKALLQHHAGPNQVADFEQQRSKEKHRLQQTTPQAFLEGLAWRQECCAGGLVAFFVLCSEPSPTSSTTSDDKPIVEEQDKTPHAGLSHASYINLWNAFHNQNYHAASQSDMQRIAQAHRTWTNKLDEELDHPNMLAQHLVHVSIEEASAKRKAEQEQEAGMTSEKAEPQPPPPPNVMTLKPRKKVKPAPAS